MSRDTTGPIFYPQTNKPYFPPKFGGDVLKLAVRLDYGMKNYFSNLFLDSKDATKFIEFRQKESLLTIVEDLCKLWDLKESENYALQWTTRDPNQLPDNYVTEDNRIELKNGDVLYLTLSPSNLCKTLLQRLKQHDNEIVLVESLKKLSDISSDPAVATELIDQGGLSDVENLIQSGQLANMSLSSLYLLTIFWKLMDGCKKRSWDEVCEKLIHEVALFVIGEAKIVHPKATSVALAIIEAIATSSSQFSTVEKEVPMDNLVIHLFNSDPQVQHNALALMNALFSHSEASGKEKMAQLLRSKAVRDPIMQNILRQKTTVGAELAHQLHVLQRNLLNMYDLRSKTKVSQHGLDVEKIMDLRRALFDLGGEAFSPTNSRKNPTAQTREYKKLGFRNLQNPWEDFELTPPGALALDCTLYFAEKHKQNFTKFISENSYRMDHRECPFVQTSVQLVNVLLELCEIGQPPAEEGQNYYEVFFTNENPFEELFSLAVVLLNRTWKEMKASVSDMSKVLTVVKEQIKRSMEKQPENFKNLENETKSYTYGEVLKLWDLEQMEKEKIEFSTPPIMQLREILKPQYEELVKTNRFYALKEGQEFAKYSRGQKGAREKGKFWYWRLSPNEKSLLYADCKEQEIPKVDEMKNFVDFEDVYEIRVGNECPHIKELKSKNKTTSNEFAFSILLKNSNTDDCYNFVAADANTFYTWIDGLNAALNKPMTSQAAIQEMEMFLRLDIKLRLIEVEDLQIPNTPPPIPPLPSLEGLYD